jgi:very-short-patch-repair endonuclease
VEGDASSADDAWRRVLALAEWQGGVISLEQLLRHGIDQRTVARRVETGALTRRHRAVFVVGGARLGMRGRSFAALLAGGRGSVLSYRSAGAHWVILAEPAVPEITVPTHRRSRPDLIVHRIRLDPGDIREQAGLAVTSPLRTLLDLATVEPAASLERAVAEAQVIGLVDADAIRAAPDHRGRARLLRALDGPEGAPNQSRLEGDMERLIRAAGLPRAQRRLVVAGHRADFAWPEHRLIVEVDGWSAHGNRAAFERDRARDVAHALAGWTVVRFTARQLAERPLEVAARLAALLSRPG